MSWVLVIEDEPDHRILIREALRRVAAPPEVHEVADAPEAQRWMSSRVEDPGALEGGLVLLDLGLPGPSGFTFLEWVRDIPELDDLPVVILTASENPMDADHAFLMGAKAYFQKPADFRDYVDLFERILGTGAGAAREEGE